MPPKTFEIHLTGADLKALRQNPLISRAYEITCPGCSRTLRIHVTKAGSLIEAYNTLWERDDVPQPMQMVKAKHWARLLHLKPKSPLIRVRLTDARIHTARQGIPVTAHSQCPRCQASVAIIVRQSVR